MYVYTPAAHSQTEYVKFVSELPEFIHTKFPKKTVFNPIMSLMIAV